MTLNFKTTINCGNCVRTVTPFLNELEGVKSWKVDTENPDKILTVEVENVSPELIIETIEDLGFDAESV